MANRLSRPIDVLVDGLASGRRTTPFDVVVVGSGYGGSVAAARLAGEGRRVAVLERGREYAPGEFPRDVGDVPGHVRFRRPTHAQAIGNPDALFDIRMGNEVDVLVGSGLGGTSLINANVAAQPDEDVFRHPAWPAAIRKDPQVLAPDFEKVATLLGATPAPDPRAYRKFAALETLARSIGAQCHAAPVTVTFGDTPRPVINQVGIAQNPCTGCGNCVSGCNVGAKNTLAMNLLPLARARGAELFTSATVISIAPDPAAVAGGYPWLVRIRRTLSEKTPLDGEVFAIPTRNVVLAAGTLGSTEILMRSEIKGSLEFSSRLGQGFSANGDALAVGYGQRSTVRAMGEANAFAPEHKVGPTIVGIAQKRRETGARPALTIEDGAIPAALRRVFGEIAATSALLQRLGDRTLPAWHAERRSADPLAVNDDCLDHSQVLLIMGDDGAAGTLRLEQADPELHEEPRDHARVVVDWPGAGKNAAIVAADTILATQDRCGGFDGGQYLANPAWRLLPSDAANVMSGALPGGRILTVHPLGGCAMGDDSATGVVDDAGRVYSGASGTAVHRGLYVLDGAIIPTALGINPFLTIAALAYRGAGAILADYGWKESPVDRADDTGTGIPAPIPVPKPAPMQLRFKEKLCGELASVPAWIAGGAERLGELCGLVLSVEMSTRDVGKNGAANAAAGERDLDAWLQAPGAAPVSATVALYVNPLTAEQVDGWKMTTVPDEHLAGRQPLYRGTGSVTLLAVDRPGPLLVARRALRALWAFHRRRKSLFAYLKGAIGERLIGRDPRGDARTPAGAIDQLRGFWNLACLHAEYRRLAYVLRLEPGGDGDGDAIEIHGEKVLAWATDQPRVWDALCNLDIVVRNTRTREEATGRLAVDLSYLATKGVPQIIGSPHTPATIAGMIGVGGFFLRSILQTSFWEFGAPDYPQAPVEREPRPGPIATKDGEIAPEVVEISVPLLDADPRHCDIAPEVVEIAGPLSDEDPRPMIRLVLNRYRKKGPPVLLIHGLAQGSLIYSTRSIEVNMASYLWDKGYDVWLLDHRISNALPEPVPLGGWSIEEIGYHDIPAAVKHVYAAAKGAKVRVFAHCIGATAVQIAILSGRLAPADKYVHSVAFNAIHPWIAPSPANDFKSKLGAFFRDVVGSDPLDPIPRPNPSATEAIIDRLAFSLARFGEEADEGHCVDSAHPIADAVCDRMTLYYGRMWRHANLDPRTHETFPDLVGLAPGDVYRQIYYFTRRGRLTTREGVNAFLTDDNLKDRWKVPTLFLHGEKSKVFNPQSATRSAIRMSEVLDHYGIRDVPVHFKRIPEYGHMDVVFAKSAKDRVYPLLEGFFATDSATTPAAKSQPDYDALDPDDDPHRWLPFAPSCGPVLREAARAADGKVALRFWAELREDVTTAIKGAKLHEASTGISAVAASKLPGCEPRYALLDAVADASGDVEFAIGPSIVESMIDTDPGGAARVGIGEPGGSGIVGVRLSIMSANRRVDDAPAATNAGGAPQATVASTALPPSATIRYPEARPWLAKLRAAPQPTEAAMRFLVGSCRYPGSPFERDAADAVFTGMEPHIEGKAPATHGVDRLFLIGDQIYADATADAFDIAPWRERYSERYRDAFVAKHMRWALAHVPTHFALDDHEIGDNWSGLPQATHPAHCRRKIELQQALQGTRSFQHRGGDDCALWHTLDHRLGGLCPTFIMDTRSERDLRTAGDPARHSMVSERQLDALATWLRAAHKDAPGQPKLIVCGVGIAPVSRDFLAWPEAWRAHDGWLGYPQTLARVAGVILDNEIRNVLFVSGDLHLSALARLEFSARGKSATVWQIVSSGLYAPLPFANAQPGDYDWNQPVRVSLPPCDGAPAMTIDAESGLLHTGAPHFLRVDLEARPEDGPWNLAVRVVGADGAYITPAGRPPVGASANKQEWVASLPAPGR